MQENKLIEHSLPVTAWTGALALTTGENLSNDSEMRSCTWGVLGAPLHLVDLVLSNLPRKRQKSQKVSVAPDHSNPEHQLTVFY